MIDTDCRSQKLKCLYRDARTVVIDIDNKNPSAQAALLELDANLRQFFDSLSSQDPVTPAELSILEDVGAQLNRAKTLAEAQRLQVLGELKGLRVTRTGITAYQTASAPQGYMHN